MVEPAIRKRMGNAPVDSLRMIFDPAIVSRFTDCGVSLRSACRNGARRSGSRS